MRQGGRPWWDSSLATAPPRCWGWTASGSLGSRSTSWWRRQPPSLAVRAAAHGRCRRRPPATAGAAVTRSTGSAGCSCEQPSHSTNEEAPASRSAWPPATRPTPWSTPGWPRKPVRRAQPTRFRPSLRRLHRRVHGFARARALPPGPNGPAMARRDPRLPRRRLPQLRQTTVCGSFFTAASSGTLTEPHQYEAAVPTGRVEPPSRPRLAWRPARAPCVSFPECANVSRPPPLSS